MVGRRNALSLSSLFLPLHCLAPPLPSFLSSLFFLSHIGFCQHSRSLARYSELPVSLPAKLVEHNKLLVEVTLYLHRFGFLVKIPTCPGVLETVMRVLLHIMLEKVVCQEPKSNVPALGLVEDLNSVNDLRRRDKNIDNLEISF